MKIDHIYLYLDGVLADFMSAAIRVHGKDPEAMYRDWQLAGKYELDKVLGLTPDQFWERIDGFNAGTPYDAAPAPKYAPGADFWISLERYPWAEALWTWCNARASTYVMTSPSRHPGSSFGKVRWLQNWLGPTFRNYILAPKKGHFGQPGSLLIDDNEGSVLAWQNRGGEAILFPRLWNEAHHFHTKAFEVVNALLTEYEYAGVSK